MAKFPIQRAQGSVPGVSGAVPIGYGVNTGAGQVAAMGRAVGKTGFELGDVEFKKQAETQLFDALMDGQEQVSEMFKRFETNQDESTYAADWDKVYAGMSKNEPDNPLARRQYKKALAQVKLNTDKAVFGKYVAKVEEKQRFVVDEMVSRAAETDSLESDPVLGSLRDKFDAMVQRGTMTAEERDARMARAEPRITEQVYYNNMDLTEAEAIQAGMDGSVADAYKVIDASSLDNRHKITLKRRVEYGLQGQQQVTINDFRSKVDDGSLTEREVVSSPFLTPEQSKSMVKAIQVRDDPTVKTDPKSWTDSYELIMQGWSGQSSPQDVYDGLYTVRYDQKDLSKDDYDAMKQLAVKNYSPDVLRGLETVYRSSRAATGMYLSKADAKWLQNVNTATMSWVDSELSKGRSPSPEDMYIRSRMYGVTGLPDVQLGQDITDDVVDRVMKQVGSDKEKAKTILEQMEKETDIFMEGGGP